MLKVQEIEPVLRQKYVVEHKTMHAVAEEMGIAVGSVYNWIKRLGIQARKNTDYEITEKQRENGRKAAAFRKGVSLTEEQKAKISIANKGHYTKKSKFGGHRKKRTDGYIGVYVPDHPFCNADGYVMEHRLVMEEYLGRYLTKDEVVHHVNHKRNDNRLENLRVMTFEEHARMHITERNKKEGMTY